ncbi:hypothetical protein [Gluconobacter oxydans]|uniref:hypothetical protein n=1 Tax=Gluconobacter oxydans TaxID=442 RepID=UPI0026472938|nr:hypothetical protein [Gluconobacter oxydans]WKE49538.1 hypothetical protein NUJ38_13645 [Gluconobacter oxydans]
MRVLTMSGAVRMCGRGLKCLAEADAFRVFGQMRRAALWSIKGLADTALPLFEAADRGPELSAAGSDRAGNYLADDVRAGVGA